MSFIFNISYGVKMMTISIISFSLMHLCVKAIPNIPIHQIITFRSIFSLLICIYMLRKINISYWGNNKKLLVLRGVVGTFSLLCFFYSIQHLPLATAVTISNLIPLFALMLASIFSTEKITLKHYFFFLLSFLGVLLIKGYDNRVTSLNLLIALLAAFFTASAHFTVRKLRDYDHPWVILFYFPLVSLILIAPYSIFHWTNPTNYEWIILVLIGIFTHVGQLFLTYSYSQAEVSNVTNIYYLGILLSLFYGYLFFDEYYSLQSLVGMFLIVLGIFFNLLFSEKNKHKLN